MLAAMLAMTSLFLVLQLASRPDEGGTPPPIVADAVAIRLAGLRCVEAAPLIARVEARVGPGSVVGDGPRVLTARFSGAATEVAVDLSLDVMGQRTGARHLGPFPSCAAAVDAAVLAISLVIDPLASTSSSISPSSTSPSSTPPSTSPSSTPPSTSRRSSSSPMSPPVSSRWSPPSLLLARSPSSVAVGAGLGVGSGFGVKPGPMVLVQLRLDPGEVPVAVGVGGRVDLPTPLTLDGVRSVASTGGAAFLEGCLVVRLRIGLVDLCGLAQAGALRAVSALDDGSTPVLAPLVTVGGSVAVRVPLWAGLGAFVRAGLDLPVVGARFSFDDDVIFESAPFAGQLSVGLSGLAVWHGEGP
jgi:hypothetical protein